MMTTRWSPLLILLMQVFMSGCPQSTTIRGTPLGTPGRMVRDLAGDVDSFYVSATGTTGIGSSTVVRALGEHRWERILVGNGGPIALHKEHIYVVSGSSGSRLTTNIVQLSSKTGHERHIAKLEGTDWFVVTDIEAGDAGVMISGGFRGDIRIGSTVVSSEGAEDGFVARLSHTGQLHWVSRIHGPQREVARGLVVANNGDAIVVAEGSEATRVDGKTPSVENAVSSSPVMLRISHAGGVAWVTYLDIPDTKDMSIVGVTYSRDGSVVVAANTPTNAVLVSVRGSGEKRQMSVLPDAVRITSMFTDPTGQLLLGLVFDGTVRLGSSTPATSTHRDSFLAYVASDELRIEKGWHIEGDGDEEIRGIVSTRNDYVLAVIHTGSLRIRQIRRPKPPVDELHETTIIYVPTK